MDRVAAFRMMRQVQIALHKFKAWTQCSGACKIIALGYAMRKRPRAGLQPYGAMIHHWTLP